MSDAAKKEKTPSGSASGHSSASNLPLFDHGHSAAHAEEHGEGNWLVSYADMMTLLVGFFVILLSFSVMDAEKFDQAKKSITEQFGGTYQIPYSDLAERIKEALKKLGVGDQLVIKVSDAGMEISFKGTVFFDLGSADLKEEARPVLDNLITSIKTEQGPLDITVEGHTDDVPINNGKIFRNNWELSSLRACRVLESFISAGLPKERLTAVGYGEARPLVPNRTAQGESIPDNQTQNRRVVIRVVRHAENVMIKSEGVSQESPAPATAPGSIPAGSQNHASR